MSIAEFLLARIAEDEEAARVRFVSRRMIGGEMREIPVRVAPGMWAWSPERVLAECEAKRRIVEMHGPGAELCHWSHDSSATHDGDEPCLTLLLLTLPYADHPQFDPEWRL